MFDEANNKKTDSQEDKSADTGLAKGSAEPTDSILEQHKESASLTSREEKKSVEDIFAKTDRVEDLTPQKPSAFQPKQSTVSGVEAASDKEQKVVKPSGGSKKFLIIGVIALAAVLFGFGGWYGYSKFFSVPEEEFQAPVDDQAQELDEQVEPEEQKPVTKPESQPVSQPEITPQPPVDQFLDSDQDGLTDEEEKQLGTDIDSVDTDKDKLFDREEVKVYKTDPLNPDTDGDGFLDGEEVKSGYDPRGEGRLYEIK